MINSLNALFYTISTTKYLQHNFTKLATLTKTTVKSKVDITTVKHRPICQSITFASLKCNMLNSLSSVLVHTMVKERTFHFA